MQQRKSLRQLIDDDDSSSSQAGSFDGDHQDFEPIEENISVPRRRNQNRNNRSDQMLGINLLETASSTISEASIDGDRGRENGIVSWGFNSVLFSRNQPLRVNTRLIYKNYCKAMIQFNTQSLSEPYLLDFVTSNNVNIDSFRNHIRLNERNITGLDGLKSMIVPSEYDTEEKRAYKRAFRIGCEVFLKYFAVNWVFAGHIRNTQSYLKHRFRLLRKIKDLDI